MNDMESRKFEESVKDAFRDAGVTPTEKVWTNIELDLERTETDNMRRRLVFYKLLVAASVSFAVCFAGVGYYLLTINHALQNQNLALVEEKRNTFYSDNLSAREEVTENDDVSHGASSLNDSRRTTINSAPATAKRPRIQKNTYPQQHAVSTTTPDNVIPSVEEHAQLAIALPAHRTAGTDTINTQWNNRKLPALHRAKNPTLDMPRQERDPVADMFAKLERLERELAGDGEKKSQTVNERLWTSLGFAAGAFNSVSPVNTVSTVSTFQNASLSSSPSVVQGQAKASGMAYSMGVSLGGKLSERWVLQGGINYMTQLSDYTTDEAIGSADFQNFKPVSLNELRMAEGAGMDSKVIPVAPYRVNNNVQFISVPVQTGYLLLNTRMGIQLNAGVATDLFLQNTIESQGGNLERTTQSRGEDSPYRTVNFSGLMGTELSYRFSNRYRVAVNPGLRYPFNSVFKSDLGINATPITFDVGLRFRYIFQ